MLHAVLALALALQTTEAATQTRDPVDALATKLHLTPAQRTLFAPFAAHSCGNSSPSLSAGQLAALTTSERLTRYEAAAEAAAECFRDARAELQPFYASLTAQQRQAFDRATSGYHEESVAPEPEPDATSPVEDRRLGHTNPDYLIHPDADMLARVFPRAALKASKAGTAVLQCVVDVSGYLGDCVVLSETPAGWGFGNAALELTAYIRMIPATTFGLPVESRVTIPIRFNRP